MSYLSEFNRQKVERDICGRVEKSIVDETFNIILVLMSTLKHE